MVDTTNSIEVDSNVSEKHQASDMPNNIDTQPQKKTKKAGNVTKPSLPEYNEADFEPGTGPLPPGVEDGFDGNIMLNSETGHVVYKSQAQRQATKLQLNWEDQTVPIRIHTDGSSLGNGTTGAFAGVGVYFGPRDKR